MQYYSAQNLTIWTIPAKIVWTNFKVELCGTALVIKTIATMSNKIIFNRGDEGKKNRRMHNLAKGITA